MKRNYFYFLIILSILFIFGISCSINEIPKDYQIDPNIIESDSLSNKAIFYGSTENCYEGESAISKSGGSSVRFEPWHPTASNGNTLHMGSDSNNPSDGVGDQATYTITIRTNATNPVIDFCYSDDMAENIINVYYDNTYIGQFKTLSTKPAPFNYTVSGWNTFTWSPALKISSPQYTGSSHTVQIKVATGGNWGVNIDYFRIRNARNVVPLYRQWNNGGDQLYTTSWSETQSAKAYYGFSDPAIFGYVWASSQPGTVPLYRLRCGGTHFWTADQNERNICINSGYWISEGITGYVYSSPSTGGIPFYRLVCGGNHYFTPFTLDRDGCIASTYWRYEGIAYYTFPSQ